MVSNTTPFFGVWPLIFSMIVEIERELFYTICTKVTHKCEHNRTPANTTEHERTQPNTSEHNRTQVEHKSNTSEHNRKQVEHERTQPNKSEHKSNTTEHERTQANITENSIVHRMVFVWCHKNHKDMTRDSISS